MLNNVKSDLLDEDPFGVPQGSVLDPIWFLIQIHVNNITDVMSCKIHLCADDTVMMIAKMSVENLGSKLDIELSKAQIWLSNT